MPTSTGKNDRYAAIIAFGSKPLIPIDARTTITIGAIAKIGMVCEAIAHGITERSIAREFTIPTASNDPAAVPARSPKASPKA